MFVGNSNARFPYDSYSQIRCFKRLANHCEGTSLREAFDKQGGRAGQPIIEAGLYLFSYLSIYLSIKAENKIEIMK
jgi:hypothetical protein